MDEFTKPPEDGDHAAHLEKALKKAHTILTNEITDTCPECGTTELLCGHGSPGGCIHEEEEDEPMGIPSLTRSAHDQ